MNNDQMMAALALLPDPELLQSGKITDPLGANTFYSARTVVEILVAAKAAVREACAKKCDEIAEHYGDDGGSVADHCAIELRSNVCVKRHTAVGRAWARMK